MTFFLALLAGACVFGLVGSVIFDWASGKSALFNIGFAAFVVLASTGLLLIVAVLLMRGFGAGLTTP
jgi:hypothetical protein